MLDRILADGVVLVHFAFIVFVVLGGLLVMRAPWVVFLHLPALAWAVYVEMTGRICPLTPLENALRSSAGGAYEGGFVDHYLMPILYPPGLTPSTQVLLGAVLLVLNAAIYAVTFARIRARRPRPRP